MRAKLMPLETADRAQDLIKEKTGMDAELRPSVKGRGRYYLVSWEGASLFTLSDVFDYIMTQSLVDDA